MLLTWARVSRCFDTISFQSSAGTWSLSMAGGALLRPEPACGDFNSGRACRLAGCLRAFLSAMSGSTRCRRACFLSGLSLLGALSSLLCWDESTCGTGNVQMEELAMLQAGGSASSRS
eukprot:768456-Hanusia_phi.AAC.5